MERARMWTGAGTRTRGCRVASRNCGAEATQGSTLRGAAAEDERGEDMDKPRAESSQDDIRKWNIRLGRTLKLGLVLIDRT